MRSENNRRQIISRNIKTYKLASFYDPERGKARLLHNAGRGVIALSPLRHLCFVFTSRRIYVIIQ